MIFQKFFYWYPINLNILGNKLFELSVGILPYPITFLITDLISEIYGKKRANQVVIIGIFASFFSMGILLMANAVPAIENSPIDDDTFNQVKNCAINMTTWAKVLQEGNPTKDARHGSVDINESFNK